MGDVDYSASLMLAGLIDMLHAEGGVFALAAADPQFLATLEKYGTLAEFDNTHIYSTVLEAVAAFRVQPGGRSPRAGVSTTDAKEEVKAMSAGVGLDEHHPTVVERAARGRAARADVPRSVHGTWQPSPSRPDPVDLLEEQAATRVPDLVPIRYGRMLVSPFTFFRGAAYLMASDLSQTPRSGQSVQLCGDAHLSNFGVFKAPDRRLVFSLNDFDETLPGPFEWDVKRLVTSFEVAGRERGFDTAQPQSDQLCRVALLSRGDARLRPEADARSLVPAPRCR